MKFQRPRSSPASKRQVRELLASTRWTRDDALGKRSDAEAWVDEGGRVLLVFTDELGRLYESRRELVAMLDHVESLPPAMHILDGRFPHGERFLDELPALLAALPRGLGLAPAALDGSVASLEHIDELARAGRAADLLDPPLFPALVAYLGEVMVRAGRGRWEMVRESGGRWEPWVVLSDGARYAPFVILFEEVMEHEQDFSLHGVVRGLTGAR